MATFELHIYNDVNKSHATVNEQVASYLSKFPLCKKYTIAALGDYTTICVLKEMKVLPNQVMIKQLFQDQ